MVAIYKDPFSKKVVIESIYNDFASLFIKKWTGELLSIQHIPSQTEKLRGISYTEIEGRSNVGIPISFTTHQQAINYINEVFKIEQLGSSEWIEEQF